MGSFSFPRRLLRPYGAAADDAILDAMPELELLRTEFQGHLNDWLPNWYRSRALEEAVRQRDHSDKLGPGGLELLKTSVEELATRAEQVIRDHLGDSVWWHYDQAQTKKTTVYAVRLCMDWLAIPLRRSGYLSVHDWRERLALCFNVPTGKKDESGYPVYEQTRKVERVPSGRLFCLDDYENGLTTPGIWSDEMKHALQQYFALVKQTQNRMEEAELSKMESAHLRKAAGVEEILGFTPLQKPPPPPPFRLPPPS